MTDLEDVVDPRDDFDSDSDSAVDTHALVAAIASRREDLDPEERVVVRMRFGLDDAEPKTVSEIAAVLGVHTNTVKAVERRALEKLRS